MKVWFSLSWTLELISIDVKVKAALSSKEDRKEVGEVWMKVIYGRVKNKA